MSPMNRVARRDLPLLILFCSISARLFAAPLIAHPLGISTGANSLHDVSSGSTRFWLTSGLGGTEPMGAAAGKGTPGSDLTSSAGTAGVQYGRKSRDGSVGSAGGSASDQGSAHTGEATSETQGMSRTADTGSAGQVTIHPHEFGVGTAKGGTGRVNPADGAIQYRVRAADPAETNRAFAGHVSSIASGSGASQPAGAAADATSGSRSPSNAQGKGTTDTTAPVPSLAPSSPTVASQPAVTPPGQSGSLSSSQASQVVSNPQGSAALAPSSPTVASQPAVTPPGQSGSLSSSQASQVVSNPQGSAALAPSSPTVASQPAVTPPGQSGSLSSSQASQVVSNPQGSAALAPSSPTVASQLNPAGAVQMPAGTPGVSSSSALPSSSAGATAGTATPQSGGSTPPASVAGPAGAASQGSNPPSNSSAVTQSPQPSSPSMVSVAPAIASVVSNPPATPAVNNANSSSAPVTNTLGAQFLISLSPSLSNVLGGAGSTAGPTSNPVSTTSAIERPLNRWNLFQHPSVRLAGELQSATSLGRNGESNPGESRAGRDLHRPCHGDLAPEHSRAAGSGHAYGDCDRSRSEACVRARRSRLLVGPRLFNRTARRRPVQQGGRWRRLTPPQLSWGILSSTWTALNARVLHPLPERSLLTRRFPRPWAMTVDSRKTKGRSSGNAVPGASGVQLFIASMVSPIRVLLRDFRCSVSIACSIQRADLEADHGL